MLWRSGGSGGWVGWSTGEKRTRDFDHVLFWVIYCAGEQQLVTVRPPRFRDNLCAETERIPGSSDVAAAEAAETVAAAAAEEAAAAAATASWNC